MLWLFYVGDVAGDDVLARDEDGAHVSPFYSFCFVVFPAFCESLPQQPLLFKVLVRGLRVRLNLYTTIIIYFNFNIYELIII